jgi:hypothetical protein
LKLLELELTIGSIERKFSGHIGTQVTSGLVAKVGWSAFRGIGPGVAHRPLIDISLKLEQCILEYYNLSYVDHCCICNG